MMLLMHTSQFFWELCIYMEIMVWHFPTVSALVHGSKVSDIYASVYKMQHELNASQRIGGFITVGISAKWRQWDIYKKEL